MSPVTIQSLFCYCRQVHNEEQLKIWCGVVPTCLCSRGLCLTGWRQRFRWLPLTAPRLVGKGCGLAVDWQVWPLTQLFSFVFLLLVKDTGRQINDTPSQEGCWSLSFLRDSLVPVSDPWRAFELTMGPSTSYRAFLPVLQRYTASGLSASSKTTDINLIASL